MSTSLFVAKSSRSTDPNRASSLMSQRWQNSAIWFLGMSIFGSAIADIFGKLSLVFSAMPPIHGHILRLSHKKQSKDIKITHRNQKIF
jgi:hypothetical protein